MWDQIRLIGYWIAQYLYINIPEWATAITVYLTTAFKRSTSTISTVNDMSMIDPDNLLELIIKILKFIYNTYLLMDFMISLIAAGIIFLSLPLQYYIRDKVYAETGVRILEYLDLPVNLIAYAQLKYFGNIYIVNPLIRYIINPGQVYIINPAIAYIINPVLLYIVNPFIIYIRNPLGEVINMGLDRLDIILYYIFSSFDEIFSSLVEIYLWTHLYQLFRFCFL